jgi:hypothetical protein
VTGLFSLRTGKITGSLQKFAAGARPKEHREKPEATRESLSPPVDNRLMRV